MHVISYVGDMARIKTFSNKNQAYIGEIFDPCYITVTRISAKKSLKVIVDTIIFFSSNFNIFLELRHMSLRYDKCQKIF